MGIMAQKILEALPIFPDLLPISSLEGDLRAPEHLRNGFTDSKGEFNFLYKDNGKMYRLPISMAEMRLLVAKSIHSGENL